MRRLLFVLSAVLFSLILMPLNAQVENAEEDKKNVQKIQLKLSYTKGLVFERTIKMNLWHKSTDEEDVDGKGLIKLEVTVNEIKDDLPTDLKLEIKEVKTEGKLPDAQKDINDKMQKLVGHWVMLKKDENKKFKIYEKSKDYPESDDTFKDIDDSTFLMFDTFTLPEKEVSVGENIKFDYKDFIIDDEICSNIKLMLEAVGEKKELMLQLRKIYVEDGAQLAYLTGKLDNISDILDLMFRFSIDASIVLDITNNRCLRSYFSMDLFVGRKDPVTQEKEEMSIDMELNIANSFTVAKEKPDESSDDDDDW